MSLSVAERARRIATFRFVHVRLMELAAAWTPTTPEMEVKVLLGRHIWDFAQQADALGKRTFELRQQEQHSLRPADDYAGLLDEVGRFEDTAERLAALYDVVLPGLERRYAEYVKEADSIMDAPSVVIAERILGDFARQRAEAVETRRELGLRTAETGSLRTREARAELLAACAGTARA
jgi:hypothetical protein